MKNSRPARSNQQLHQINATGALDDDGECDAQYEAHLRDNLFETQPTSGFAADLGVQPQTVRKEHSKTGAYLGIRPIIKLPNRHLRWPLQPISILTKRGKK
jgi:hypothetical protein